MNRAERQRQVEKMVSTIGNKRTLFRVSSSLDDLLRASPSPCWVLRGFSTPTDIWVAFGVLPVPRRTIVLEIKWVNDFDSWLITSGNGNFFLIEEYVPAFSEVPLEAFGGPELLSAAYTGAMNMVSDVPLAVEIAP